jgi:hypothetical protein
VGREFLSRLKVRRLSLLLRVQEFSVWKLDPDTRYIDWDFLGFSHSLESNTWKVPENKRFFPIRLLRIRHHNRYGISHSTLYKQYSQHSVIKEAILASSSLEVPFLARLAGIICVRSIVVNWPRLLYCN